MNEANIRHYRTSRGDEITINLDAVLFVRFFKVGGEEFVEIQPHDITAPRRTIQLTNNAVDGKQATKPDTGTEFIGHEAHRALYDSLNAAVESVGSKTIAAYWDMLQDVIGPADKLSMLRYYARTTNYKQVR